MPDENDLIQRLFDYDDTILLQLLDVFGDELMQHFCKKFHLDRQAVWDVMSISLLQLTRRPQKFDPSKSTLRTFLYRDIEGDLLNALEKNRRPSEKMLDSAVELQEISGNISTGEDIESALWLGELKDQVEVFFASIFTSETDRRMAWMVEIERVRETEAFVEMLGIQLLSISEAAVEVKRHKDRIKIQLKRHRWDNFKEKLRRNV